jgi:predicted phosphodiesterase
VKISLASDVHLEFGDLDFENDQGAEVLILSGDICVAADVDVYDPRTSEHGFSRARSDRIHEFFARCCNRFDHVIYIVGNHEYYHSDFSTAFAHLKNVLGYLPRLHVLEKESVTIGDVTFLCGTLWTDMNREDPDTLYRIRSYMNDFRIIKDSRNPVHYKDTDGGLHTRTGKLSPEATVEEHQAMLKFVEESIDANPTARYVVVGHHAPSKASTHAQYADQTMVNGAYSSNLDEFILNRPQIKLWTHGHTHHPFDYMIGSCRIMCNPRGYDGYEQQADLWRLKTVDI